MTHGTIRDILAASSRCHIAIFLLFWLCGVLGRVMTERCTAVHWSDFVSFCKLHFSDSENAFPRYSCKIYFWDIVISSFVSMPLGWRWPRDALVVRPWLGLMASTAAYSLHPAPSIINRLTSSLILTMTISIAITIAIYSLKPLHDSSTV